MNRTLITTLYLLTFTNQASAKMVLKEVEPSTTRWRVTAEKAGALTSFTFYIPFKNATLPKDTTATLEVFDGEKPLSSATLQLQSDQKETFFRFTVATWLLAHSRFVLTHIDAPHPAGDRYWANLKKFAQSKKKVPVNTEGKAGRDLQR